MAALERFGVSMEKELLERFDALLEQRGYPSRSEAIRDLIRDELVSEQWTDPKAEVIGTVTIVFSHHEHELSSVLAELQHQCHECIICSNHIHMDAHNCLEVIIVRGQASRVKYIADTLTSTRGVKHGQLVCTAMGGSLT